MASTPIEITFENEEEGRILSPGEETPLIDDHLEYSASESSSIEVELTIPSGKANMQQTILNISKACMGTGTLALPHAASEGGLLISIIGLALICLWNLYSVDRLVKCANMLPLLEGGKEEEVPMGTSKFGKVAWYAFGRFGLQVLDGIMMLVLMGIIIAYESAAVSFIQETPFTTGYTFFDACIIALVIFPLSCSPDLSFLSKFSAMGVSAIFLTFSVIFAYGIHMNGLFSGFQNLSYEDMFPQSLEAICKWFGVTVFTVGIVPIIYNIQDSMSQPGLMSKATEHAFFFIFVTYIIIGDGIAIIYHSAEDEQDHAVFKGDVIQHLPQGWLPTIVRVMMTAIVITTVPLLVVPCGELVEGRLCHETSMSFWKRAAIRIPICFFYTSVSISIPDFVSVISFIGCFGLALISFVFPPLFYMILAQRTECFQEDISISSTAGETCEEMSGIQFSSSMDDAYQSQEFSGNVNSRFVDEWRMLKRTISFNTSEYMLDKLMLVWGIFATVIATVMTFLSMVKSSTE